MRFKRSILPPAVIAILTIPYFGLVLGWRGTSGAGVHLLERLRLVNDIWMADKAWKPLIESPHPALDLAMIPAVGLLPGDDLVALGWISMGATALAVPAVWILATRYTNRWGAVAACLFFVGVPMIGGAATASGPGAVVLCAWTWLLALASADAFDWKRGLALTLLASLLALSWTPVMVWMPIWFVLLLVGSARRRGNSNESAGSMIRGASVDVGAVVATAAVFAAPTLLVLLSGAELGPGLKTYFNNSLLAEAPPIVFGGQTFDAGRPPMLTGAVWWLHQLPTAMVGLAVAGLVAGIGPTRKLLAEKFSKDVCPTSHPAFTLVTLLFVLALPWALGSRALAGVDHISLAVPLTAVLAGAGLVWLFAAVVQLAKKIMPRPAAGMIAGLLAGAAILPAFYETARLHPLQGSYYNTIAGRTDGAFADGHPAVRDDVLPIIVAESTAQLAGAQLLEAEAWTPHLGAYMASGLVPPLQLEGIQNEKKKKNGKKNDKAESPIVEMPPAVLLRTAGPGPNETAYDPITRISWKVDGVSVFEALRLKPPPAN